MSIASRLGRPNRRIGLTADRYASMFTARVRGAVRVPPALALGYSSRMETERRALISFFEQVARKDKAQLAMLTQEQCFRVERTRWCFTLPDLYSFLQRTNAAFNDIDYKQFRKLIFSSPINQAVKPFEAEIIVADNRAKVDQSAYALVWGEKSK